MDLEKSDHLGQRSISTSFLRCAHVNILHAHIWTTLHCCRVRLDNRKATDSRPYTKKLSIKTKNTESKNIRSDEKPKNWTHRILDIIKKKEAGDLGDRRVMN
jgi:hypothetical protein